MLTMAGGNKDVTPPPTSEAAATAAKTPVSPKYRQHHAP